MSDPIHPGQWVRQTVLKPKKMSVTAAARVVGVGRPAMSRFLNGHVTTSPDMAARIERAFGIPAHDLLDRQAAYDAAKAKAKGVPATAKRYVPPFLSIKANDIETWASSSIKARSRLSVFLRTLVHSTGSGLQRVDFPGNDDAERPGWDGHVDAADATAWIPRGLSGWEFGVNVGIKEKADEDYAKSVKAIRKSERGETTFVFVTPRRWSRKKTWEEQKRKSGQWKDVRAYDASDLEQWLEQSIAGQTWFANETLRPSKGVRTLDKCWTDWADVAEPSLAPELLASTVAGARRTVLSRVSKPPSGLMVVAADSAEEALAFLAQIFGPLGGPELAQHRDRVLVFDEPGVLSEVAQGSKDFIAVTASRDVEREMATLASQLHTIAVYPRNAANAEPDVLLEPLSHEAFRKSLEAMGHGRDDISRLSDESGRSLTVLRRRLSTVPAIKTPDWAKRTETVRSLVPFVLVGAWNAKNGSDQAALEILADAETYEALENDCQQLALLNDAPVWSVGAYRGAVSKLDLLFAIAGIITTQDLKRYFDVARFVLGEDDPKLDLPESERWAASLHGKSREFSSALRKGISESLVLLAVHGNHLFRDRLGFDCEIQTTLLVREILSPLSTRVLEANDRDLPLYAEAAPDEFLSILEADLKTEKPETHGLMRPGGSAIFGGCPRTGLLWALETLSWNPETLPRSALILAQLSEIEIDDNWANKPVGSLESIFRVWMPQTAAAHDDRLAVMKLLAERFPNVAWKICVDQLDTGQRVGHYSHKPRWRTDAHGFGEPFPTTKPIYDFMREMVEMALDWGEYTPEMLCDLIAHLRGLPEEYQTRIWELVRDWAKAGASSDAKALVREKIRVTIMSRRAMKRDGAAELASAAKEAYAALEPDGLLHKHEWLFRQQWVEESADELDEDDFNFEKRQQRIAKQRADALRAVMTALGIDGVIELAKMGKSAFQIGWLMATEVLPENQIADFALRGLQASSGDESSVGTALVMGALRSVADPEFRTRILNELKGQIAESDFVRVLLLAPFRRETWEVVDDMADSHRAEYWNEVEPEWIHDSAEQMNEAVERLIDVQRPRAAFAGAHLRLEDIRPDVLFRLMSEIAKEGKDKPDTYRLDRHYIAQAFELLDKSPDFTLEQKAGLEFAYMDALSEPWGRGPHGIPNLEKLVEAHPEFFVQAVVWAFKRDDDEIDPPNWQVDEGSKQHFAEKGYKLTEALRVIPGHNHLGELSADHLLQWVSTVREACLELSRLEIGDRCIGKLLSRAPPGTDGVWPCEPVRDVMEEIGSVNMLDGARLGRYNARGATFRQVAGDQERELASQYRAWAELIRYSHPFVSSRLLMQLAETYDHEAARWDNEARLERRLQ